MNRATSNRRLKKLADFLMNLPRQRFDYNNWVGNTWKGKQDLSCGTTGCALGWAATMSAFRRLGLRLEATNSAVDVDGNGNTLGGTVTDREGYAGLYAAERIFGLTYNQAEYLFIPMTEQEKHLGPKMVALKIARFIKKRTH